MQVATYVIGIDPGTKTGVAIWSTEYKKFLNVETRTAWEALLLVKWHLDFGPVLLRVEDPNTWVNFGHDRNAARAKAQGAGSVKRDFAIWREFAEIEGIAFEGVSLHAAPKKLNAVAFKAVTGWEGRTSEHARDAAMLCFQHHGRILPK